MKEELNVANVDYTDLAEKVSKMREEIYLLKRQVEEQQLIKENREAEERKKKKTESRRQPKNGQVKQLTPKGSILKDTVKNEKE